MNERIKPTREEIINEEVMTPKEARYYIRDALKISDSYYQECIYPRLRDKFKPIGRNFRHGKLAMLRIKKSDLDDEIYYHKKKLFD